MFSQHAFDEIGVEAFKADGLKGKDLRDVVRRDERIRESENHETPMLWSGFQLTFGLQDRDTGAFGANQRARNVESVFRQELVEVIAGDAPRNVREALAYEGRVCIAQMAKAGVDLTPSASVGDDSFKFLLGRCTHAHPSTVIEQHVERFDIVDGLPA